MSLLKSVRTNSCNELIGVITVFAAIANIVWKEGASHLARVLSSSGLLNAIQLYPQNPYHHLSLQLLLECSLNSFAQAADFGREWEVGFLLCTADDALT